MNNPNIPNSFYITDTRLLFFDIFYKNNKIYLIMPIYNKPANPLQISITVNKNELSLSESYVKDSNESALIYVYNVPCVDRKLASKIEAEVICCEITKTYTLQHIVTPTTFTIPSTSRQYFLTLTTLFQNDYHIFPLFYNYYKSQGVSHFYMYYNGTITSAIQDFFSKYSSDNVTLIEWNFHYWNPRTFKYSHHAQPAQMHHAIYKYGKSISDYMIFCDLDEYLHIPVSKYNNDNNDNDSRTITLKQYIENNSNIDIFGFCNIWASTIDGNYPSEPVLPEKILIVETHNEYRERSKNIYNLGSIQTVGIHQVAESNPVSFNKNLKSIIDLQMYHFYNWSRCSRTIEKCNIVVSPPAPPTSITGLY
jgi:hypothetical protein